MELKGAVAIAVCSQNTGMMTESGAMISSMIPVIFKQALVEAGVDQPVAVGDMDIPLPGYLVEQAPAF